MVICIEINTTLEVSFETSYSEGEYHQINESMFNIHGCTFDSFKKSLLINDESLYIGTKGGIIGTKILDVLNKSGINHELCQIRHESSQKIKLLNGVKPVDITLLKPKIVYEELESMLEIIRKYIKEENIFYISIDGISDKEDRDNYIEIVRFIVERGGRVVLYSKNKDLRQIIQTKPYFLVTDKTDFEDYFKVYFDSYTQLITACMPIIEKNIDNLLIVGNDLNIIYLSKENTYKIDISKDVAGKISGISLAAGISSAIDMRYDKVMSLRLALAFSLAQNDVKKDMSLELVKYYMNFIEAVRIG